MGLGLAALLLAWHLWGYVSSRVEQLSYTVIEKHDGYEIRTYPAHIVAQTTVEGEYRSALNEGFRIVAGYIFGANISKKSIAMTAPVTETPAGEKIPMTAPVTETSAGETIAMTAPVQTDHTGNAHTIAFSMPASYTLETLPQPTDPRVRIVAVPEQTMAVRTVRWYVTPGRIETLQAQLLGALERDHRVVVGKPLYAGYNAPWTPPWLTRNEVLVPIRQ
jgi:hypothetical protein